MEFGSSLIASTHLSHAGAPSHTDHGDGFGTRPGAVPSAAGGSVTVTGCCSGAQEFYGIVAILTMVALLTGASNGETSMGESDKLALIASITASFLRRNSVGVDQIGTVVSAVAGALEQASKSIAGTTDEGAVRLTSSDEKPKPAVPIKKSVLPEHIVCLEDGFHAKTLKRHLRSAHGMTPQAYRAKWRLPNDYPMVAPAYSERRSKMAKALGLGRKPGAATAAKPKRRSKKASATNASAHAT
jgi:predicted transcriptional regulator